MQRVAARRADITRFIFLVVLCLTAYSCALDDGRVTARQGAEVSPPSRVFVYDLNGGYTEYPNLSAAVTQRGEVAR